MFLLMLTELYFFQRDKQTGLPSRAIQLVLLGLKCLVTDQKGKPETLTMESVSLDPLSIIPCWEKKETHTHENLKEQICSFESPNVECWEI